ncbi:hypothetical protein XO10_09765 [Marinitoga sp. 1135]|uniref:pyrroline-5-carboxylate reductase n=1 Tax=unclassified Marinitoga TaxID=2640159 RepID=UPI0015868653|nr:MULTISPECIES: pyrroline-5-carboxylate reductase [unclassified Marinitoga]NUU96527.1 hypothetical protein [Marinitoga sp. 1135]NUU98445.1 hypothetical protein [Marinitoga sp. 1138]
MKIGIIGIGNIGSMLVKRFSINKEYELYIYDVNKERIKKYEGENIHIEDEISKVYEKAIFTFVSVKPVHLKNVFDKIKDLSEENRYIISTAAGKTLDDLYELSGKKNIFRIMPTVISNSGLGTTAIAYNPAIPENIVSDVKSILSNLGEVLEIEEKKFDAFTVLNSSGPAFVAYIIESFLESGINIGLSHDDSLKIVANTFMGTLEYLKNEELKLSELKYMVSSPGGVTIKGLYEMDKATVKGSIMKAIEEAYLKNKKL